MGCLFAVVAAASPRLVLVIFWLIRPNRVDAAFDSVVWPLLGFVFAPLTTLVYVLLDTPGSGLTSGEKVWIGLALLFDIGHVAYGARRSTARAPTH